MTNESYTFSVRAMFSDNRHVQKYFTNQADSQNYYASLFERKAKVVLARLDAYHGDGTSILLNKYDAP